MMVAHSVQLMAQPMVDSLTTETREIIANVSGDHQNVCHAHVDRSFIAKRNAASTTKMDVHAQNKTKRSPVFG